MTATTENKGKRFAIVAILLVVIAGLATAAALVMVNRSSDTADGDTQYVITDVPSTTPVFEPRDAAGNDPFFPLETQLLAYQEEVEAEIDQQVAQAEADAEPGETVERPEFNVAALDEAVKTGLCGGTEENTCDPERLISVLYANPDLLDSIRVDYYGTPTPLKQVASISVPEARMLVLKVFDRTALGAVEKAIMSAPLGLNPSNDGEVIRIPLPPLTEERRKELAKLAGTYAENAKIAIRNVRRDGMEALKEDEKKKEISEDDRKKLEEEVQKMTDRFVADADEAATNKEKEILTQ